MSSAKALVVAAEPDDALVAKSPAMRAVCQLISRIASSDAAVLIRGEPGVGKQRVAQTVHRQSRRACGPFVTVACGLIRESELGARLFSPEGQNGVPCDAAQRGLLEAAHKGTLFLANVDFLPMWAQVLLFDHLQHRRAEFQSLVLDVRLVASSSCDLEAAMQAGRFHSGLYYLLNVVEILVPPLRERPEDIGTLAEQCLAEVLARRRASSDPTEYYFTKGAWEYLLSHDWSGNLPELMRTVTRGVAMAYNGEIGKAAIAGAPHKIPVLSAATISVPLLGSLEAMDRCIVKEMIRRCGGNKAAAARALGLQRRTLYRILQEVAAVP